MGDCASERVLHLVVLLALARRGLSRRELAARLGRSPKQTGRYIAVVERVVPLRIEVRDGASYYSIDRAAVPEWLDRLGVTAQAAA